MKEFSAKLEIIGINPFVFVPVPILDDLFEQAARNKSPIPIHGAINGMAYQQTLVKYRSYWRLYVNGTMLKNSSDRIGEIIDVSISYDPSDRSIPPHPKLLKALEECPEAKTVFDGLPLSRQKEIIKYISFLKTRKSIEFNVDRAVKFLLGKAGL